MADNAAYSSVFAAYFAVAQFYFGHTSTKSGTWYRLRIWGAGVRISSGAPILRQSALAYPNLRRRFCVPHGAIRFPLVALKVHSVVEDAYDFDRAVWRYLVHQEVASTPTLPHNVERAGCAISE
jgi:hypothetical protein